MMRCERCGKGLDDPKEVRIDGTAFVLCERCVGVCVRRDNAPRPNGLRTYGRDINRHSGP